MKKYKYSVFVLFLFSTSILHAQSDEVTLTVMGQGKTVEEAQQQAFRDAIMQTYGVFVSSNTEVVNDKLKLDSVNTITNGSVKKYDLVSKIDLPDGSKAVTLRVVVSTKAIDRLLRGHDKTVDFNGSTFAFEINQQRLNEANEPAVIANLMAVLAGIAPSCFDYSIAVDTPRQRDANSYGLSFSVKATINRNSKVFRDYLFSTISAVSMSKTEIDRYKQLGKKGYSLQYGSWSKAINFRTEEAEILFVDRLLRILGENAMRWEIYEVGTNARISATVRDCTSLLTWYSPPGNFNYNNPNGYFYGFLDKKNGKVGDTSRREAKFELLNSFEPGAVVATVTCEALYNVEDMASVQGFAIRRR